MDSTISFNQVDKSSPEIAIAMSSTDEARSTGYGMVEVMVSAVAVRP